MIALIAVPIALLSFLFLMAAIALAAVCRHRYCRTFNLTETAKLSNGFSDTAGYYRDDNSNIADNSTCLRQVDSYQPEFDDEEVNDSGVTEVSRTLAPICVRILKTCHDLTEKLVDTVMADVSYLQSSENVKDIVNMSKRVNHCVDNLVTITSGFEDIKEIESKSASLARAIRDLLKTIKGIYSGPDSLEWTREYVQELETLFSNLRSGAAGLPILQDCEI